MTGNNIIKLRNELKIQHKILADVLGVHISTIYRWESYQEKEIALDTMQARIITVLIKETDLCKGDGKVSFGNFITDDTLASGGLYALFRILKEYFKG